MNTDEHGSGTEFIRVDPCSSVVEISDARSVKTKRLADIGPADAFGIDRGVQTLDRFARAFTAELERLEMNREKVRRAGAVGHVDCLLRRAMRVDPRVVRADRHDREIERTFAAQ